MTPSTTPTLSCEAGCRSGCLKIIDFWLVNSAADVPLRPLRQGETLSLSGLQMEYLSTQFTVTCHTMADADKVTWPWTVGSVGLRDNFDSHTTGSFVTDNAAPYTLAGDVNGNYFTTRFDKHVDEQWTITCQAFCDANLQGEAGLHKSLSFWIKE